ncbi:mitogen-activated protein kinase kinase kinase [Sarracenia purpurea var. burkii]
MEVTQDDAVPTESGPSYDIWWPSNFMEKLQAVSLFSSGQTLDSKESRNTVDSKESTSEQTVEVLESHGASQILWATGKLSEPIPNGFYSVVPERRLKEFFNTIPSLDELYALDSEGLNADVIIVDADKDKKLSMLKQLTVTLVKGLNSNPQAIIKKIAGLVCSFGCENFLVISFDILVQVLEDHRYLHPLQLYIP